MSVQGNNTGSGKSTQPPAPSYEAAATKPLGMGVAPPAAPSTAPTYSYRYEDGTTGASPFMRDAAGNVKVNAAGGVSEGTYLGSSVSPGDRGMSVMGYGGAATGGGGGAGTVAPGAGAGTAPNAGTAGGPTFGGGFGAGPVPGAVDDTSRRRVEQAILARLEPQFRSDESKLRNQLVSSGLEVGSPAYASELDRLQRGQNDARQQAILTGGTEESRQVGLNAGLQSQAFGQGLQGATFDNQTRQQMLSELLLQRNTPLNELNSLRTGSQVSTPQFGSYYTNNTAAAPVFDAANAQGNYNLQAAQQNQSGMNSFLGGLAGLGGAGIMKYSDIRLKTNVQTIGKTPGGIPLYSWEWKDGSGSDTGVIAQEVQVMLPDAVMEDTSGFLMVDYSKIH